MELTGPHVPEQVVTIGVRAREVDMGLKGIGWVRLVPICLWEAGLCCGR